MCIEYNECHYGGMYNVYVKEFFFITEIVHMNEKTGTGVNSEKEKVKESQSQNVTPSLDTPIWCRVGASHLRAIRPTHTGSVRQLSISDMARPGIF